MGTADSPSVTARSYHQALVWMLMALTVVTGIVDATSYLALGRVFLANMTGNVVLLGFAISGARGLSVPVSLTALAGFLLGAVLGGRLGAVRAGHRGRHLASSAWISAGLLAICLVVSVGGISGWARYAIVVLGAAAMGVQNATARTLGIANATTTVLTLTLTGMAADSRLGAGTKPWTWRPLISVLAMLAGALVGGVLVLHADASWALVVAVAVAVAVAGTATIQSRRTEPSQWTPP